MFIDSHNHLLFNIDDGSKSNLMTLEMLKIAESEGIKQIILTPHYIPGFNSYDKAKLVKTYEKTKQIATDNNIPIELYLGNELYLGKEILACLDAKDCMTMAGSDYILVEFPNTWKKNTLDEMLYELMFKGYRVILAHVERYELFTKNPEILRDFIIKGCYAQMNASSISDQDKRFRKVCQHLIKNNFVHIIATDAHSNHRRSPMMRQSYEITRGLIGDKAEDLFYNNPLKVIKNETIRTENPIMKKKRFFIIGG